VTLFVAVTFTLGVGTAISKATTPVGPELLMEQIGFNVIMRTGIYETKANALPEKHFS
jgi:hypothetical protein